MRSSVFRAAAQAALVVSLSVGFAATGAANSSGIVGASGKNNGFYCRNCHVGGVVPTVEFDGPAAVAPGSTATFRFTVTSHSADQAAAGFNVAASDGVLTVSGDDAREQFGEVTHTNPKANDAEGRAVFEFTWEAPMSAGTYTLFGAGTSANLNEQSDGDRAARATFEVAVGVATLTPTPTTAPPTSTPTSTATEVAPGPCVGDCNDDVLVTIDELVTGVNMALGSTPLSACPVFDATGNGIVTIDELLRAVNNALNGCPPRLENLR